MHFFSRIWERQVSGDLGDLCSFTIRTWECQLGREFTIKGSAIEVIYIFFLPINYEK
jgi:hypothetical protein